METAVIVFGVVMVALFAFRVLEVAGRRGAVRGRAVLVRAALRILDRWGSGGSRGR